MENFFAKNIKYLRKKKNIDQRVMAEDLGVAQSTLSCWENGLRTPDLDMVAKISKYLNVYDDFISKDLTSEDNNIRKQRYAVLYDKIKDLPEEDLDLIDSIVETRIKQIDKELGED